MKTLLLTVATLAMISLIFPTTGFADYNEVAFYSDMDRTASQIDNYDGGAFNVYAMIRNPYNIFTEVPVENICGFQFWITLPENTIITESIFPNDSLNIGRNPGEYIVGYGYPHPVIPGTPTLILTLEVIAGNEPDQLWYLTPTSVPSIPGLMAYLDCDNMIVLPLYSATGADMANPIFAVNPILGVVDVDEIGLGSLKAIYR